MPHDIFVSRLVAKGFLTKQGEKRKSWKLRWFVLDLTSQTLSYFADERSKAKKQGEIPLRNLCRAVMPAREEARANNTLLVVTDTRTYHMHAPNEKVKLAWFYLLQACAAAAVGLAGASATIPGDADRI